ncbi:MAG: aconitate hydratase AcnA [Acidiferrobacteraceae bacterium]|nr:aconitate hydratase AcnA [Acidiferrobacteraceae bacterium]|tara:strand:- start:14183 stop:16846 length:2664 start_codon:yes stop_codon:yes gene_type:complete
MNSFKTKTTLNIGALQYQYHALDHLLPMSDLGRMPYSIKILLENLLRNEDNSNVTRQDICDLTNWDHFAKKNREIAFTPARVLMQDFTGVPAIVDMAAMREALVSLGGDPKKINPLSRTDLVIDHSVTVDYFGSTNALAKNAELEFSRNHERYSFLRWGQQAFSNFRVVPPATGIVHQVNLEYLSNVVGTSEKTEKTMVYPDSLVGTDSHTTMANGLGVLGWGVGGIEAEAAMLGQPITMVIPEVVGFHLEGRLYEGVTATDLVLQIVEMLREIGVVGKFVEFFGNGLDELTTADQATISNMAPEYGATCGMFPIDESTLDYLRLTGRSEEEINLVSTYTKKQGMFRDRDSLEATYSDVVTLDLCSVRPSIAGPKRPQDRMLLSKAKEVIGASMRSARNGAIKNVSEYISTQGAKFQISDGAVVIAAITSCTNTSNPSVMIGAGLLAANAIKKGLEAKPWVKTSLAPGSQVVTDYLKDAGLLTYLERIGFSVVGYGCTTCIGNSGPLPEEISTAVKKGQLLVCSVLSGNRNFEGRVHAEVHMNFLASPPLVVAYALAGTTDINFYSDALGYDQSGEPIYLRDIWPKNKDIEMVMKKTVTREKFTQKYVNVFRGDSRWSSIDVNNSTLFQWDPNSTYIRKPPYFSKLTKELPLLKTIRGARALTVLGDSITTDHISPAGAIRPDSPAGIYLFEHGISAKNFNSYGSRRGNHEVMMRGTFANTRLRNEMVEGTDGGWTKHQPTGKKMTIYEAAMSYRSSNVPLVIIAGKEYGTGSSRDWAAKGPYLLGIKAVLAESFERIHRQNLVGMGIIPLQFLSGESRKSYGINGTEIFDFFGLEIGTKELLVKVSNNNESVLEFQVQVRIDTPKEWSYYENGGILHYVVRQLLFK